MSLVLVRIDDRLIHGQVVEGWLRVIQAQRIVVGSEEAASDPFQISLMKLAVPADIKVEVLGIAPLAESLKRDDWAEERVLLLLPGLKEARRLVDAGVELPAINLGGLHDAPGRRLRTPSLSLNGEDVEDIRYLLGKKILIETRALPGDEKISVEVYLK